MNSNMHFFDFAAEVGMTKHLGGHAATERLLALCHVQQGQRILDVGCGAGTTACYIAGAYDCEVVGIDILPRMIERAEERAQRLGVADKAVFRTADAQSLPFEDETFDAVLTESVSVFPKEKQHAVDEYVRVTKSGGYIGLNESTWLKTPPPPELLAWVSQDVGTTVEPLDAEGWQMLLKHAGLVDIVTELGKVDPKMETRGLLERYGAGSLLRSMFRGFRMYLRNPSYRDFVREVNEQGIIPDNLSEYFGYGLFVGRKPDR